VVLQYGRTNKSKSMVMGVDGQNYVDHTSRKMLARCDAANVWNAFVCPPLRKRGPFLADMLGHPSSLEIQPQQVSNILHLRRLAIAHLLLQLPLHSIPPHMCVTEADYRTPISFRGPRLLLELCALGSDESSGADRLLSPLPALALAEPVRLRT